MEDICLAKTSSRFVRHEVKQVLYAVLAAILCFVGPTYFVVVISKVIPQIYAIILGFICFLIGIVFVLQLVKE